MINQRAQDTYILNSFELLNNDVNLIIKTSFSKINSTSVSFFQNLAVSDLLFVIICITPTALDYAIDWPLGDICCRIMQYIIHVTCCTSVITLVSKICDKSLKDVKRL